MYPDYTHYGYFISYGKMKTIILHFVDSAKPWTPCSYFYAEWLENYRKAEAIDLLRPRPPCKIWTKREIRSYLRYLAVKKWLYKSRKRYMRIVWIAIELYIGKAGIIIRRISPRLYRIIKSWMPDISRPRGA
jgi:lipopolysaccharide biosynthesis glycosyltransferase